MLTASFNYCEQCRGVILKAQQICVEGLDVVLGRS